MLWFFLSTAAAFFDATYFALLKMYLKKVDVYLLATGVSLLSFLFTIPFSIAKGLPAIETAFYPYFVVTCLLEVLAMVLYLKALEHSDLSLSIPMLSFTPVFLIATSFFILGEKVAPFGAAGILFVVAGSYILNKKDTGGLLPFKELFADRGNRYMLLVAALWGVETNFVKIVVLNSDPLFAAASFSLGVGIVFLVIALAKGREIKKGFSRHLKGFALAGAVVSLSGISINYAFTMEIVPYVISIKRLSILISVFYGALVFHEREFKKRLTGAFIMLSGALLILLF